MKNTFMNQLVVDLSDLVDSQPTKATTDALRGQVNACRACEAFHKTATANDGIHIAAATEYCQLYKACSKN